MKRVYLFLVSVLVLLCWNAQAQTTYVFPTGETLYFEDNGENMNILVRFINSVDLTSNTGWTNVGKSAGSIVIPSGCFTQVECYLDQYGSGPTLNCDPTKNVIKFTGSKAASWNRLEGVTYATNSFTCGPPPAASFPEGMTLFLKASWGGGQWDSTANSCKDVVTAEFTESDGITKKRVSMDMIDRDDHLYKITVPAGTWEEVQFFQTDKDLTTPDYNWTDPLTYEAGKNRINLTGWRESQSAWQSYSRTPGANIFQAGTELYLDANGIWNLYGATVAVSFSSGSGVDDTEKLPMTNLSGNIYVVKIPAGNYTYAQFFRMDPSYPNYYLPWNFTLPMTKNTSSNCVRITNTDTGCANWPGTYDWNNITPPSFFPQGMVLYLSTEEQVGWKADGAVFKAEFSNAGGSVILTAESVSNNIYKVTVPPTGYYTDVNFLRTNPVSPYNTWNSTGNSSYSSPNDMVIVQSGNYDNNKRWGVYVPPVPVFSAGMRLYLNNPSGSSWDNTLDGIVFLAKFKNGPTEETVRMTLTDNYRIFKVIVPATEATWESVQILRRDKDNSNNTRGGTSWHTTDLLTHDGVNNRIKIGTGSNNGNVNTNWESYSPVINNNYYQSGKKLYLKASWSGGDWGNGQTLTAMFSNEAADTQYSLMNKIANTSDMYEIEIPAGGNWSYVQFFRGNGSPSNLSSGIYNVTLAVPYNSSFICIQITDWGNSSNPPSPTNWIAYTPPSRLSEFNFFPIIANWETPGVTPKNITLQGSTITTNTIVENDNTDAENGNLSTHSYRFTSGTNTGNWDNGLQIEFDQFSRTSDTRYLHFFIKTDVLRFQFLYNGNNSPIGHIDATGTSTGSNLIENGNTGYIGTNGTRARTYFNGGNKNLWFDFVVDLQNCSINQLSSFRISLRPDMSNWGDYNTYANAVKANTSGYVDDVNKNFNRTFYIDEIIVNSDPNPRTSILAYGQWTGAVDNDWNNKENWSNKVPPFYSSDIFVPSGKSNYPELKIDKERYLPELDENTYNDCNSITLGYGAQIANPHLLTYKKAAVQLDLLSNSKMTDQWHMMSMPIQGVVSGDMSFGAKPRVYMRKFDTTSDPYETGGTANFFAGTWTNYFSSNKEPLKPAEGFVLWVNPTPNDNLNAPEVGGILEFPTFTKKHLNGNNKTFANPYHEYNEATQKSTFYPFTTSGNPGVGDPVDVERDDIETYGDPFKLNTGVIELNAGDIFSNINGFALVGNPYPATLSWDAFKAVNGTAGNNVITDVYKVYEDTGGQAANMKQVQTGNIAPFQAFIVEKNPGTAKLKFDPTMTTNVNRASLRSVSEIGNQVEIVASCESRTANTLIQKRSEGTLEYGDLDSRHLTMGINNVPGIYTLKPHLSGLAGLCLNVVNSDDLLIPLAIATTYEGNITLTFKGLDNYDAEFTLIDYLENKEINLSSTNNSYTFAYTPKMSGAKTVSNEERFAIQLTPKVPTALKEISKSRISVIRNGNSIQIAGAPSEPIRKIYVYNAQGAVVYANTQVNQSFYSIDNRNLPEICIIQVMTTSGVKNVKLINK